MKSTFKNIALIVTSCLALATPCEVAGQRIDRPTTEKPEPTPVPETRHCVQCDKTKTVRQFAGKSTTCNACAALNRQRENRHDTSAADIALYTGMAQEAFDAGFYDDCLTFCHLAGDDNGLLGAKAQSCLTHVIGYHSAITLGKAAEATEHCQRILELNPNDEYFKTQLENIPSHTGGTIRMVPVNDPTPLSTIYFVGGQSKIDISQQNVLNATAGVMKGERCGYTLTAFVTGKEADNDSQATRLRRERLENVKSALVSRGVSEDRLELQASDSNGESAVVIQRK